MAFRSLPSAGPVVVETHRARNATLLAVSSLTIMSGAAIAASLPSIEVRFQHVANVELLSRLVLTLSAIFIACFSPVAGFLIDRFGRKRLLVVALITFALAGSSGLFAETLTGLLAGRAILGIAVGGIMTAVTALVGDYFTGSARDRYMGLQQAFVGIGGTLFLTGGGFLAEVHWRMPFLVYGLAFLLLPAAILFIREPQRRAAAHTTGEVRRTDRTTVVLLGLLLAGAMFNMVVFYMIPTQLPFFLKSMGHNAPSLAGGAIGLGQMVGVGSALLFARIRQRLGVMGVFALAFGSIGAAFLLLSMVQSYGGVLVAMAISGIGMGTIMPNFAGTTMLLAPSHLRGRISGLLVSSIFLGQFLSPLASQPLIAAEGFAAAWGVAGLAALVIAFGSLAVRLGLPLLGRVRQGDRR